MAELISGAMLLLVIAFQQECCWYLPGPCQKTSAIDSDSTRLLPFVHCSTPKKHREGLNHEQGRVEQLRAACSSK